MFGKIVVNLIKNAQLFLNAVIYYQLTSNLILQFTFYILQHIKTV